MAAKIPMEILDENNLLIAGKIVYNVTFSKHSYDFKHFDHTW